MSTAQYLAESGSNYCNSQISIHGDAKVRLNAFLHKFGAFGGLNDRFSNYLFILPTSWTFYFIFYFSLDEQGSETPRGQRRSTSS